jgi:prevent-host-death family protein
MVSRNMNEHAVVIMKIIPLSEARTHLSKYGRVGRKEPVIVTVNGHPAFELVPLNEDDDLVDQLLEHNPDFRDLLRSRLREPLISAAAAARRI